MRKHWLFTLFVVLLLANAFFIMTTSGALPERIASHFAASGDANDYMTRDGYRIFMLLFAVGFPLVMAALISCLAWLMPNITNIPNRAYWLAPERRETTFAVLSGYALWLGCLLVLLMGGVHWLLVRANAVNPPKLENGPFIALLLVFVAATILWTVMLLRRFRNTS